MELSVREVAALLGKSPRTVRAQVARGELPGKKRRGEWRIERRNLPLTDAQRTALQDKAERVRHVIDEALPSRLAQSSGQKSRSIADLDSFRLGVEVLAELRSARNDVVPKAVRDDVAALIYEALLALAEAVQLFDRERKLEALNRARAGLARSAASLLIEAGIPPAEPVFGWVTAIESEVIPKVAGFARWADRLRGKGR